MSIYGTWYKILPCSIRQEEIHVRGVLFTSGSRLASAITKWCQGRPCIWSVLVEFPTGNRSWERVCGTLQRRTYTMNVKSYTQSAYLIVNVTNAFPQERSGNRLHSQYKSTAVYRVDSAERDILSVDTRWRRGNDGSEHRRVEQFSAP